MGDFDIVIPVGPSDSEIVSKQLTFTKKNIIGYRNIYLISYDPSINFDGCITIDENIFPFNKNTVVQIHGDNYRNGWYLQQLLKLYASFVIPDILDKYLVIDSDTLFLKPTTFIEDNKCLYNYGDEHHEPYFQHIKRMDNELRKMTNKSGICHHMIFEKKYIQEMFNKIEGIHNDTFYNIFLKYVLPMQTLLDEYNTDSGASEYELYFNYMLQFNSDKIKLRPLHWCNSQSGDTNTDYDYISYHWYLR